MTPNDDREVHELRRNRDELAACLSLYVAEYPAFRGKPVGGPNSEILEEHDRRILIEDRAKTALRARQP